MNSQKQKRRRGVILTPKGLTKLRAAKSQAESAENNGDRYTLEVLSDRTGLDPDTIMKVFAGEVGVDKRTLSRCFKSFNLVVEATDYQLPQLYESSQHPIQNPKSKIQNRIDWGEAPDVSAFYGRTEEIAQLRHWILGERCRLVTLLGRGGMGKTCLSVKVAQQLQGEFKYVIWRSLLHAPSLNELLAELLQFFSDEQETNLLENTHCKISHLIRYLKAHHCLLVLDNAETILLGCDSLQESSNYCAGYYRKGYESYGELLKRVGETSHQSCLLLTSREKPKEIGLLEGTTLPVRLMQLKGLQIREVQEIFKAKGAFSGSPAEWSSLVDCYAGNPWELNIVSATIKKLFDGNISEFLRQNKAVFGDIYNLLEHQFKRLSNAEKTIIQWLAFSHCSASFSELREQLVPSISLQRLLEAVESLEGRNLIEKNAALFSLQPVVREFLNDIQSDPLPLMTIPLYSHIRSIPVSLLAR